MSIVHRADASDSKPSVLYYLMIFYSVVIKESDEEIFKQAGQWQQENLQLMNYTESVSSKCVKELV